MEDMSWGKKVALVLGVFFIAFLIGTVLNKIDGSSEREYKDFEYIVRCGDAVKSTLKNPASYKYIYTPNAVNRYRETVDVNISYSATNSFGGRLQETASCEISIKGKILSYNGVSLVQPKTYNVKPRSTYPAKQNHGKIVARDRKEQEEIQKQVNAIIHTDGDKPQQTVQPQRTLKEVQASVDAMIKNKKQYNKQPSKKMVPVFSCPHEQCKQVGTVESHQRFSTDERVNGYTKLGDRRWVKVH